MLIIQICYFQNYNRTITTKELVSRRPNAGRRNLLPRSLEDVEEVQTAKLLGILFQSSFSSVNHVECILKVCSQRIFLLKQPREGPTQLHTIFHVYYCCESLITCSPCFGTSS